MKSDDYWSKRMDDLNEAELRKGEKYIDAQNKEYDKAMARIKKETEAWYGRLAKNNNVSMSEARKILTANELKEFHWDVEEYIKRGRENAVDQRWLKQLENASAKVHITRLEELETKMRQEVELLAANRLKGTTDVMGDIYKDGYYKGIHEVQRGVGEGLPFAGLDTKQIDKVLSKPWAPDGRNFSSRVWQDRDKLMAELQTVLTQDLIRGDDADKVIADFAKRMNVSKTSAERLILTEAAYFSGQSRLDGYKETRIKHYKYVATMDTKTSDICRDMEGKVFPLSEAQVGVNYPPLHAYCRSTTIPHFDDKEEFEDQQEEITESEVNKGDDKPYEVPEDITYDEWADKHAPADAKEAPTVEEPIMVEPPKVKPVDVSSRNSETIEFKTAQEATEWVDEVSPDWLKVMTPSEKSNLRLYTGDDYVDVNAALREGIDIDDWKEVIDDVSKGIQKFILRDNIVTYRGISDNYLKGINPTDLIGAIITDAAFQSSSLLKDKAFKGQIQLQIHAPAGSRGAPVMLISSHPEEFEYLLDKETRYVILEATEVDGVLYLIVEVIPDDN
ncbi:MAG TPA: minor capsid protein [Candidatus Paenibacillus intestinavium]|nr:minor capsid protein [Candidatus Paenibacillus intestinavium]